MKISYTGWMWVRDALHDTELFKKCFIQCIKELSYLGYDELENMTFLREMIPAKEVKNICEQYGVKMGGLFANFDEGEKELKANIDYISQMCGHWMICAGPNWPADQGNDSPMDVEEIQKEAALLTRLCKYGINQGVNVIYNPHSFTPVCRRADIDFLASITDPDLVRFCIDVGHSLLSGVDPERLVKDYKNRVSYIHLKDIDPQRELRGRGLSWVPLGQGIVDLPSFIKTLQGICFSGPICVGLPLGCEDINCFESARLSREYLKNQFHL